MLLIQKFCIILTDLLLGYVDDAATFKGLKEALDSSDREIIYLIRTIKSELIRYKLAECIENENITTAEKAWEKSIELMKKYNEKPRRAFLDC